MTVSELRQRLLALVEPDLVLHVAGTGAPADADLDALERELVEPLPADYRAFQRVFGGLFLEAREDVWPRPGPGDVVPPWRNDWAIFVLGIGEGIPDFLHVGKTAALFRQQAGRFLPEPLLPVAKKVGHPDFLCYDRTGSLWTWRHADPTKPLAEPRGLFEVVLAWSEELASYARLAARR